LDQQQSSVVCGTLLGVFMPAQQNKNCVLNFNFNEFFPQVSE
jgi:hypothetical protein